MVEEKLETKMQDRPKKKTIPRMFVVDAEDSQGSSDNSSSSASSRLTSAASRHSSITSDNKEENASNELKVGRKPRKWFRLTHNKVVPL